MNKKETVVLEFIEIYAQFIGKSKVLFKKILEDSEYSRPLLEILKYLSCHGKSKTTDLVNDLMVTKPYVTAIVDKLVSYELVYREHDLKDRRVILVDLTDKGKEVVKEFNNKKEKMVIEQVKRMTNEEVEDLMHMMEYMKDFMNGSFFKNI